MTNETIADIIAEMRGIRVREFQDYADRFDAAHRREVATTKESLAVGNSGDCAKLREAVKNAYDKLLLWNYTDGDTARMALGVMNKLDAALSALPRNCDKYSHDEALNIWAAENENERNGCFDEWLYHEATEQEGGNDGNE